MKFLINLTKNRPRKLQSLRKTIGTTTADVDVKLRSPTIPKKDGNAYRVKSLPRQNGVKAR